MPVSALEVLHYWPADRAIEELALDMLPAGQPYPDLMALLQEGIALAYAVAGLRALPAVGPELRGGLQTAWEAVERHLASIPAEAMPASAWDLVRQFIRRRARCFAHLRRSGITPPLIIPFEAAAVTPAGSWPPDMPVGDLFPLFDDGHKAVVRLWEREGPRLMACRPAANHFLHAIVWEEFLTCQVTGDPPEVDPAWFRVGVGAYTDLVQMADPLAAWEAVAHHTAKMLEHLRARHLTGRQPYRGLTFHFTLWYGQCHALHHVTQAEDYLLSDLS